MNSARTWAICILTISTGLVAVCRSIQAETWRATSDNVQTVAATENASATLNWQQRVLKKPVSAEQPVVERSTTASTVEYSPRIAQRATVDRDLYDPIGPRRQPCYSARRNARFVADDHPEVIPPGDMNYEPLAEEGAFAGGGCNECGYTEECGDCGSCGGGECCDFGYEVFDGHCNWWIKNLTVFGGIQGFKGPVDWGANGNFGFHEGLGVSGPVGDPWGIGYQIGARFLQSDVCGVNAGVPGTDRTQYFVTAGLFRRQLCRGWQWGVVWDYMHDRYYDTFKLNQLRADVGFVLDPHNELGFHGAFGANKDTYNYGNFTDITLDPTDMYTLYFRRNFDNGGNGRFWGGATGRGDGIIGADLWVPLGKGFALQNTFNFKIPKERRAGGAASADEAWGVTIQLVWYPGKSALCQRCNPYRPLMDVADNATFMVDQIVH